MYGVEEIFLKQENNPCVYLMNQKTNVAVQFESRWKHDRKNIGELRP